MNNRPEAPVEYNGVAIKFVVGGAGLAQPPGRTTGVCRVPVS